MLPNLLFPQRVTCLTRRWAHECAFIPWTLTSHNTPSPTLPFISHSSFSSLPLLSLSLSLTWEVIPVSPCQLTLCSMTVSLLTPTASPHERYGLLKWKVYIVCVCGWESEWEWERERDGVSGVCLCVFCACMLVYLSMCSCVFVSQGKWCMP